MAKTKFGPDHQSTISALCDLAELYMQLGQPDKAEPLLERALEICRGKYGNDNPNTISILPVLGDSYRQSGKLDKAPAIIEEA